MVRVLMGVMIVMIVMMLGVASAEPNTERRVSGPVGTTAVAVTDVAVALTQPGSFAAGWHHSLLVLHDGTVWAWGRNHYGQLGDGTTENRMAPVQVAGSSNVRSVAAGGAHSLAILEDGGVWAWGRNTSFEAGDESREDQLTPVRVPGLVGARSIAAGNFFSVAALEDGSVWTWGSNAGGQLGVVMMDIRMSMPVQIEELSGVRSVAAGEIFALAVADDGSVWAWGFSEQGQLGIDTGDEWRLATPARLEGFEGAASVGDGSTENRFAPVEVSTLEGVVGVAGGSIHSLAAAAPAA